MKSASVICTFCLALTFLTGCVPEEYMYVEVIIQEDSPPVIKLSADASFETPVLVKEIAVFVDESGKPRKFYWSISTSRRGYGIGPPVSLREVVYGVVPDGLTEWTKALPLEPDAEYGLEIWGGVAGVDATVYFTNKPGRYLGHGSSTDL